MQIIDGKPDVQISLVYHEQGSMKIKPVLHYTRAITPKRAISDGVYLCGSAPAQRSSEETSLRWQHCVRCNQPGNRTPNLPHR